MFKNIIAPTGWFYSDTFAYWQKTKGRIVVYVSRLLYGYQVQLYIRGDLGFCELEARTSDMSPNGYNKMFKLGESWLNAYEDGDLKKISTDPYCISNPNGVWIKDADKKTIGFKYNQSSLCQYC